MGEGYKEKIRKLDEIINELNNEIEKINEGKDILYHSYKVGYYVGTILGTLYSISKEFDLIKEDYNIAYSLYNDIRDIVYKLYDIFRKNFDIKEPFNLFNLIEIVNNEDNRRIVRKNVLRIIEEYYDNVKKNIFERFNSEDEYLVPLIISHSYFSIMQTIFYIEKIKYGVIAERKLGRGKSSMEYIYEVLEDFFRKKSEKIENIINRIPIEIDISKN